MCETHLKFLHRKLKVETSKQSSTNTVSGGHSQCLCVSGGCDDSPNAHNSELQVSPLSMGFKVKDTRLRYLNDKLQRRILIFLALIFKPFFLLFPTKDYKVTL